MEIGETITCRSNVDAEKVRKDLLKDGINTKHILQITDIQEAKKDSEHKIDAPKSVSMMLEEIASEICDHYCKYPYQCKTEEELQAVCWDCPLVEKL